MSIYPDQAFILAAGKGTRLKPYTDQLPKPLVPVRGKPILHHTLEKLQNDGVQNIIINTHYFGDMIKSCQDDFPQLNIQFSNEKDLLNTGGGVKKALSHLKEKDFFMINGDAFWDDSPQSSVFERLSKEWNPEIMDILLLLQPISQMNLTKGIGDYDISADGQAKRSPHKNGDYMFAGIRITKPSLFEDVQEDCFSFLNLMDEAEAKGKLYGLVHNAAWHHISTPEDLERVNQASEKSLSSIEKSA
ncbi:MAG: nucleotidyltransferase family protein [Pseudomonadota bacterium]